MVNREIKARKRAVKEEKEEIDGEIVRIRKGHPRTNLRHHPVEESEAARLCEESYRLCGSCPILGR